MRTAACRVQRGDWLLLKSAADTKPRRRSPLPALFDGEGRLDAPGPKPTVGHWNIPRGNFPRLATRACRSDPDRTMLSMRYLAAGRLSASLSRGGSQSSGPQVQTEGAHYRAACHLVNGSKLVRCLDPRRGATWEIRSTMALSFLSGASLCSKACGVVPRRPSLITRAIWDH